MYSEFVVRKSDGMICTNVTLKTLGTLRGVFGAEIDRISGNVLVTHTDEIKRDEIKETLESLGYFEEPIEEDL